MQRQQQRSDIHQVLLGNVDLHGAGLPGRERRENIF